MTEIKFYCLGCWSDNKHQGGNPGYEVKEPYFESFSDAVKHVIETQHDVSAEIRELDEEE